VSSGKSIPGVRNILSVWDEMTSQSYPKERVSHRYVYKVEDKPYRKEKIQHRYESADAKRNFLHTWREKLTFGMGKYKSSSQNYHAGRKKYVFRYGLRRKSDTRNVISYAYRKERTDRRLHYNKWKTATFEKLMRNCGLRKN